MPRLTGQRSAASWSYDNLETLKRMWREGKTAKEIAAVIPYSRSAVLAMARRQNLASRRGPTIQGAKTRAPAVHSSIVGRIGQAIDMVADRNLPLREAAERAHVPFKQLRGFFNFLVRDLDMGELPSVRDDVVRPVRP